MQSEATRERVHADVAGHATGSPESPDVSTRVVVMAVAGFFMFAAVSLAGLFVYYRWAVPGPLTGQTRTFPEPRLQASPEADLARMRAEQRRDLERYGWRDRVAGTARIPIRDAMAILAARGQAAFDAPEQPEQVPSLGSRGGASGPAVMAPRPGQQR